MEWQAISDLPRDSQAEADAVSPSVEFIDENGGGPGVRLRNRQRPKQSK
jgi:hypothetical protein